ncbi:hypothetical protein [Nocardia xishanensis]|uniref:hypothetical protein n=1 Tax=Nocardia xishanensis TaxID=238964 RepID=UPI000832ACAD|nr:hypothetical protein [Nocardia xishanensis]
MTPEDIRACYEIALAEQLEIIAPSWIGAGREGEVAADVVDALAAAGLLPTGAERLVAYAVMDTSDDHVMRRYVTEWQPEEAE